MNDYDNYQKLKYKNNSKKKGKKHQKNYDFSNNKAKMKEKRRNEKVY